MVGLLPTTLNVNGRERAITHDFRPILAILIAFNDINLSPTNKHVIMLESIYNVKIDEIPDEDFEDAIKQALFFIDCGKTNTSEENEKKSPILMDWIQDEQLIFSGISMVARRDVRMDDYCHWWSFMGYYMEIGEGTFATVRGIRSKLAKNEKLDKWEKEFLDKNRETVMLKRVQEMKDAEFEKLKAEIFG